MALLDTTFAHALRMFREGRLKEADAVCRSLLKLAPDNAEIVHLLAAIGCRTEPGQDSLAMARRAVAGEAQRGLFINTLGVMLRLLGRKDEASAWFGRALRLDPLAVEPRLNLGGILADRRDPGAAREMRRALALAPQSGEAHNNLGAVDMRSGVLPPAILRFQRALALTPLAIDPWRNLGGAYSWQGRIGQSLAALRRAIGLGPASAEAHDLLGNATVALGDAHGAQVPLRRATTIRPSYHDAGSNLLFALAYDARSTAETLAAAQRAWAARVPTSVPRFANDRDPERRIRLGYLSGDFRVHPVAWSAECLIRNHDRSRYEVRLYSTSPLVDETTAEFAALSDGFLDLASAGPEAVAGAILDDRIDVLVAVAPHTAYNSAVPLAAKPAPVVISLWAIGSTGLPTVDYWLTDDILHPPGRTERFTERLLPVPCLVPHSPITGSPDPGPPPSGASGFVTFGSFHNPAKVTPEVVALWSRVLKAVPDSRLLLRNGRRFGDPATSARYRALFARHDIGGERLMLEGEQLSRYGHLEEFRRLDVALDPFPFNGSTTTYESLWMGVPVVARIGDRFIGRMTLDTLTQVGLTDLATVGDEAYVAAAATLAADLPRRARLRAELRERLLASPHLDAPAHARAFEAAIRGVWRDWCASP